MPGPEEQQQRQDGVISRAQALTAGLTDNDVERRRRRREWAQVHPGVYVDHTGPLTWQQRLWAAVLFYGDAAAGDESVLALAGLGPPVTPTSPVHVVVDHGRRVIVLPGVQLRRMRRYRSSLHPVRMPPQLRLEVALLRVASRSRNEDAAVAVLADACQARRTHAPRLLAALGDQPVLPQRRLLEEVLTDVATGACSAFERRYLRDVERAHGLPAAQRQRRLRRRCGVVYRDADYLGGRVVVELDGRLWHSSSVDRWRDLDRDLESAESGSVTVRVGWGQVLDPCRLAGALGRLLRAHGWPGEVASCGATCRAVVAAAA